MLEILERIVAGEGRMEDLDQLEELATMIRSMALCGLGKSAPLPVLSTLKTFREEYEEHIRDHKCRAKVCQAMRRFIINPDYCKGCGNVRRTVLLAQSPVCVKNVIILIRTCVSSAQHVKTTVHLTLFMLKCRKGEKYGNHYN